MRTAIVGSGSEIAKNRVTNEMLSRLMETSDSWIRERSGVETRYYVDPGTATSDLGVAAAERALEMAKVSREEVDLVVFATMTPDHFFPGAGSSTACSLRTPISAPAWRARCFSWAPRSTRASCPGTRPSSSTCTAAAIRHRPPMSSPGTRASANS